MIKRKSPLVRLSLGAVALGSLYGAVAHADGGASPFATTSLADGYAQVAAAAAAPEGRCGEGKCGGAGHDANASGKDGEGKCGEGRCGGAGADQPARGGHARDDKAGEGKCGEGRCGGAS